jgi:hypothetical protein
MKMKPKSKQGPKLHSFRRNLKGAWADVKNDFISGDGALVFRVRFYLAVAVVILLGAIAKFGFGLF